MTVGDPTVQAADSNSPATSESKSIQRKTGVSHGGGNVNPDSENILKSEGENNSPPPPYSEENTASQRSRSQSRSSSITPAPSAPIAAYTIPKDLSGGLSNPVFTHAPTNPDENDNENQRREGNNNTTSRPGISARESFTSLHSNYGQYASPYHKDPRNSKDTSTDFDTEKGPPSTAKDDLKKEKAEYQGMKRYLGLLLTLSASFFFSVVVLFVKILTPLGYNAFGASFWRYTGTIIPTLPLLLFFECGPGTKKQTSVFTSVWPIWENQNWKTWIGLVSRGLIGSTSVILRYYALKYLSIGDTSVITYATPVLVTVLAHFFLGEKCGIFQVVIAFFTLIGVIIVSRPPLLTGETDFDTNTLIGTGLACGSLLCSALIVIITRKIRKVHFTVMTIVFGVIGVAQALILIYFFGTFNMPTEWFDSLLVAGIASLSWLGQMSIVLALKFEQAGPVALVRSCDVLFGFLLQYVFLHVSPDIFSGAGAVIVLSGVLSTGFRKWLNTLPQDDSRRRTWRCVLM